MVKLSGPMFSLGARGKFGDAIVYSIWKGIPYARQLVIPTNPEDPDQGDRRTMLGGLGRSAKYIQPLSLFETYGKVVAPAGQSWISYYIHYIMVTYFTNVAGWQAVYDAYSAHAAQADFDTRGVALGLTVFNLAYRDMPNSMTPGMQMYCLALYGSDQYALDNTKFDSSPYDTALADWVDAEIVEMVADFTP